MKWPNVSQVWNAPWRYCDTIWTLLRALFAACKDRPKVANLQFFTHSSSTNPSGLTFDTARYARRAANGEWRLYSTRQALIADEVIERLKSQK